MSTSPDDRLPEQPPIAPAAPPRFQFGLFTMFVVMTAVAVACSLTFTMPHEVAIPLFLLLSVILTAVLITVIIYGRGYQRTFCIGAVVPFGVLLLGLGFTVVLIFIDGLPANGEPMLSRLALAGVWASSILTGTISVGVRRLVEKRAVAERR